MIQSSYHKAKALYQQYERFLIPGFLLAGFVLDVVTFKTLEIQTALILLGVHLLICAGAIVLLTKAKTYAGEELPVLLRYPALVAPFFMQLSFGALLSAAFIFYSFSGVISVSWPLIGMFLLLMISNEIYKQAYLQTRVQLLMFFIVLFSTLSIALPFLLTSISSIIYFSSLALAAALVYGFFLVLKNIHQHIQTAFSFLNISIAVIICLASALYIANLVPPIPLTVRDSGIYHELKRVDANYEVQEQKQSWLQKLIPGRTIYIEQGRSLYVFTAIYAPDDLNTAVVHHWQWFDPATEEWRTMSKPSFSLRGGRQNGFRGYSVLTNLREGKWQVFVETTRGQVMGKKNFTLEFIDPKEEEREYIEKTL